MLRELENQLRSRSNFDSGHGRFLRMTKKDRCVRAVAVTMDIASGLGRRVKSQLESTP